MKKILITFLVVLSVATILPLAVEASWWNPISWFTKSAPASISGVVAPNTNIKKLIGNETSLSVKLGDIYEVSGIKISIAELVEDSRCPTYVECFQAGTVRLKVNGNYGLIKKSITYSLNEPVNFMGYTGTLVSVMPERIQNKSISLSDYVFKFEVVHPKK